MTGLEPRTYGFGSNCSTNWATIAAHTKQNMLTFNFEKWNSTYSLSLNFTGSDLKVDGGYGAMSAEGHGEQSSFAGTAADNWNQNLQIYSRKTN